MDSLCTARTVRAYFADGTLPEDEAHCDVDSALFPSANAGMKFVDGEYASLAAANSAAVEKMSLWRIAAALER